MAVGWSKAASAGALGRVKTPFLGLRGRYVCVGVHVARPERRRRGSRFQPGRAGRGSGGAAGGRPAGRDGESAGHPQAALEEIHVRGLPAGLGRTLALWEALVMRAGAGTEAEMERGSA